MPTASINVTILNRLGLHARPAMSLVDLASGYACDIKIQKDKQVVDAKSIMQLMMLAATKGTALTITANGDDAEQAIAAIESLVNSKFDED